MKDIPVVIPSYEPDRQLVQLCKNLSDLNLTVIVIDDGSGEEYAGIFREIEENYRIRVLRHAVNLGKGRGLKTAFNDILLHMPDAVGCVTADSDGQHTPEDIIQVGEKLREHPGELILGCRDFGSDHENIPWKSRFGNRITQKICRWLCGINVTDTQTGLRAIPREFMQHLMNTPGERFEFETNMLIESKDHFAIREIPIQTIYDSKEDHKTHFDPFRDSVRIYAIFGRMFGKFLLSSLSSSVLDLVLFHILCSVLKPSGFSLYVAAATVIARIVSATYNYLINYSFVFRSSEKHAHSAAKYILLACIQMLLSAAFVTAGVRLFAGTMEVIVKVVVDTVLFFISYYIQHEFVFRNHRAEYAKD